MARENAQPSYIAPLVPLGVKVAPNERERIAAAAAAEGLSVSEFTRRAIQRQLGLPERVEGRRRRRFAKAPEGVGKAT
jgi:hypothetical protein